MRQTDLAEATNPKAYDANDVNWSDENGKSSVRQELYREYFLKFAHSWTDKSVLDVGSGTGWLCNFFSEHDARSVEGIEPSGKSLEFARQKFPNITFHEIYLINFLPHKSYDFLSCVMVLINLRLLDEAFTKFNNLLKPKGELL